MTIESENTDRRILQLQECSTYDVTVPHGTSCDADDQDYIADPLSNSLSSSSLSCACSNVANGCAPVDQAMSGFIRAGYLNKDRKSVMTLNVCYESVLHDWLSKTG